MINVALPKGRLGEKVYSLLESIGYGCPEMLDGSRKLIFGNAENKVRAESLSLKTKKQV